MATNVAVGAWIAVANGSYNGSGDRGDLAASGASEDEVLRAAERAGYHHRVVTTGIAGELRTPRGMRLAFPAPPRCACGSPGSWDEAHITVGRSGPDQHSTVWAGCTNRNHPGQTLGLGIRRGVYDLLQQQEWREADVGQAEVVS